MVVKRIVCNRCRKAFDQWDEEEGFSMHGKFGYGTKYDGEEYELDLCCSCMEWLVNECAIHPISWRQKTGVGG